MRVQGEGGAGFSFFLGAYSEISDHFYSTIKMQHNFFLKDNLTLGIDSKWISKVGSWSRQSHQHELLLGWFF